MKAKTLFTALALALMLGSPAQALIENDVEGAYREDTVPGQLPGSGQIIENGVEGAMREDTLPPTGGGDFFNTIIKGMLWVLRV